MDLPAQLTRGLLFACVFLCLAAAAHGAQADPCLVRAVPVTVITDDGKPTATALTGSFKASVNGNSVRVTSVARYQGPRRIVIVLDTSPSMMDKIHEELALARKLVESAAPEDSFALLWFSKAIERQVGFEQGRRAVAGEIDSLSQVDWAQTRRTPGTALLDALMVGVSLLRPARIGDAIYVISDGEDNASRTSPGALTKAMEAEPIRCFWAEMTEPIAARPILSPQGSATPDLLRHLAENSGGMHLDIWPVPFRSTPKSSAAAASAREASIIAEAKPMLWAVDHFFEVQLTLPAAIQKTSRLKIEAVVGSGRELEGIELIYPHHLAPCSAGPD